MLPLLLALAVAATQPIVQLWPTHALQNVFPDTAAPEGAGVVLLSGARRQIADAQLVISAQRDDMIRRLEFSPLTHADGSASLPAKLFRWHFIEYHQVNRNSTQTPPEELLRQAPADFPDAFSEERTIKLAAGRNQPIWVQLEVCDACIDVTDRDLRIHISTAAIR